MKWRTVALLLVVPAVLALGACQVTLGNLSVTWDEPLADPQPDDAPPVLPDVPSDW